MNSEMRRTPEEHLEFMKVPVLPSTPVIDDSAIIEISNLEYEDLGNGLIVFKNAFSVEKFALDHIDARVAEVASERWKYIIGEDGVEYGINEDGFRYRLEDVPNAPTRLLAPVDQPHTPQKMVDYFVALEDAIYKCLIRYVDMFPLVVGSLWWRTRGHVLRYEGSGMLGWHQDNDTNYKVTGGVRYMPKGMVASRQTAGALAYFNDCVDTPEELNGENFCRGSLKFPYINVEYKPKKGDIIFFPTNYICSHGVTQMHGGTRYAYLTFFGQGGEDYEANIRIVESSESRDWCAPVWFDNIYDDYERYCKSQYSIWSKPTEGLELGSNPVFQNRCVTQYGTTHTTQSVPQV
jgi:hypothetical protein